MGTDEINMESTDYVIGKLTSSLEATTKALHDITDRLQLVTMTVETLNSKLNSISEAYSRKIDLMDTHLVEMRDRLSRDYDRLNRLEQDIKKLISADDVADMEEDQKAMMEGIMRKHIETCSSNRQQVGGGSEQRMFFIIISVLSVVSTIVALVK